MSSESLQLPGSDSSVSGAPSPGIDTPIQMENNRFADTPSQVVSSPPPVERTSVQDESIFSMNRQSMLEKSLYDQSRDTFGFDISDITPAPSGEDIETESPKLRSVSGDDRIAIPSVREKLDNQDEKRSIVSCLHVRDKYMRLSLQRGCSNVKDDPKWQEPTGLIDLPVPEDIDSNLDYALGKNGIYELVSKKDSPIHDQYYWSLPTMKEFINDLIEVLGSIANGPIRTFAYRQLQILETNWKLYLLQHEEQELYESRCVYHRDFYNVRMVDTHVHHSSAATLRQLGSFIRRKLQQSSDEIVLFRDGKYLSLREVFKSLNISAYDINIDTLNMHAHKEGYQRFDRFNLKYNPLGESRLRNIFLKTDNFIRGKYLAEMTRELIDNLEKQRYVQVEWRLSIYGFNIDEWDKLSAWIVDNNLFSSHVRWLIQIPRLYDVHRKAGMIRNFQEMIRNIFEPLFEVTRNPESHPKLHIFLKHVVGFDSVDDESKPENRGVEVLCTPEEWEGTENPPYYYWLYYMYSNIATLNFWRSKRQMNIFVLRPHCGEGGKRTDEHLAAAFLTSFGIAHGILLRKSPLLEYLYYLDQIPIAMSPLSNNALFLRYEKNPFYTYFKRGLNVSLSTDDPLQFMFTDQPLLEEYTVAAQIYHLSSVDMCELARNSVLQSGFEDKYKRNWLGASLCDIKRTNVPLLRLQTRKRFLKLELVQFKSYGLFVIDEEKSDTNPDSSVVKALKDIRKSR